jgi:hypothetical protein
MSFTGSGTCLGECEGRARGGEERRWKLVPTSDVAGFVDVGYVDSTEQVLADMIVGSRCPEQRR